VRRDSRVARPPALTQRLEYTSRHNVSLGRHGWLRLMPAYSARLVDELLAESKVTDVILDPFGGTGTTALLAASKGRYAVSLDINPFLVWLARAKLAMYSLDELRQVREAQRAITRSLDKRAESLEVSPPIHGIERWWSDEDVELLRRLKGGIRSAEVSTQARDLLLVAFCRVIYDRAKLTRRHPSLSFRTPTPEQAVLPLAAEPFLDAITAVLPAAADNPYVAAVSECCDARDLSNLTPRSIDIVITSPPYPNRVTVIRELRPYMYWLDYLKNSTDSGALDWRAIGGTWGAATHRLKTWELPPTANVPPMILAIAKKVAATRKPAAKIMANYILRYFADMTVHVEALASVMRHGGRFHYVVGNSSFYGNVVETEKALMHIFVRAGFVNVRARALRKRTSKTELFEYVVEGAFP
jgi:16S rRNA G966 N2-methylase RsmD